MSLNVNTEVRNRITSLEHEINILNAFQSCKTSDDFYNLASRYYDECSFDTHLLYILYLEAAKLNHKEAYDKLIDLIKYTPHEYQEQILSELVNTGNPHGMYELAKLYLLDENASLTKIVDLLERSIMLGCIPALKVLGDVYRGCYYNEFPINYEKAIACYEKGKSLNDPHCINSLGICHKYGQGVPQNDKMAWNLFVLSTALGNRDSFYHMAKICDNHDHKGLALLFYYKDSKFRTLIDFHVSFTHQSLSELYAIYASTEEYMIQLEQQVQENDDRINELENDHTIFMQQFT